MSNNSNVSSAQTSGNHATSVLGLALSKNNTTASIVTTSNTNVTNPNLVSKTSSTGPPILSLAPHQNVSVLRFNTINSNHTNQVSLTNNSLSASEQPNVTSTACVHVNLPITTNLSVGTAQTGLNTVQITKDVIRPKDNNNEPPQNH